MFHRAASSSNLPITRINLDGDSRDSTKPTCAAQHPLTTKSNSIINLQSPMRQKSNDMKSATRKSHVLLQPASVVSVKANAACDVFFNEDDFDDDLDLNFDIGKEPIKAATNLSQVSWPPSSYVQQGDKFVPVSPSPILIKDETCAIASRNTAPKGDVQSQQPSSSPSVQRKPRRLPWDKDVIAQRPLGVQSRAPKTYSTAAALQEVDIEEEDIKPKTEASRDKSMMDPSARKQAIKLAKDKKRSADEMSTTSHHEQTTNRLVAQVFLSKEQKEVIELIKKGKSVFFTGSAGTGKSVLLREAIKELKAKYQSSEKVAVTASTGLAACNIGGITLHSFAGVGLAKEGVADLVKKVKKQKKNLLRWTKTKVLIIDEISMVDADLFDKLEALAREVRKIDKPWGGIQIVATGDFFQLPPVPDRGKVAKFSFEAVKWPYLDHTIQLTTVFRQRDEGFVKMLNQMRTGQLTARTIDAFKLLAREPRYADGLAPTELFPTREEVDRANATRMQNLPGPTRTFEAEDSGQFTGDHREKLLANCMAPKKLDLRKGAQVMLIKNRDESLVNGSLGVIVGFMSERLYTFAVDEIDGTFDEKLLRDSPWTDEELAASDRSPTGKRKMLKLMAMQQSAASSKIWPVVRFKLPGGRADIHQLMSPESWKFEAPNGEIQACRKQVPLILAYAISIHKAQGQTIERVKVDLGKVFEKGQAYVALSRAVSQDGLQVLRFNASKVMAHPKVAAFYRELSDVSSVVKDEPHIPTVGYTREEAQWQAPLTTQEVFEQIKREPQKAFSTTGQRRF